MIFASLIGSLNIAHAFGKYDSRNAEECRAQVNANYDARQAEMTREGNYRGIDAMNRRQRAPDLADCDQMERRDQQALIAKAMQRLTAAIDSLREQKPVSEDSRHAIDGDHDKIAAYPTMPMKDAYLRLYGDYLQYAQITPLSANSSIMYRCKDGSGRLEFSQAPCADGAAQQLEVSPQSVGPTAAQCAELDARIREARKEHDAAVAALLPQKDNPATNWREEEDRRETALSKLKLNMDKARIAGCAVTPLLITTRKHADAAAPDAPASHSSASPDADAVQATGSLQPDGSYLVRQPDATITMLANHTILVYGYGPELDEGQSQSAINRLLRARKNVGISGGPDPSPKAWDPVGHGWRRLEQAPECKSFVRYLHTATALADGKVLIAGGLCDLPKMADDTSPQAAFPAMSLWDSSTRKWMSAPALNQARIFHTSSLLPDGGVLIAGGESDPALSPDQAEPVLNSVELYAGGSVTPLPSMNVARAGHTASVLPDGSVMVIGGFDADDHAIATAELWSPGTRSWQLLPSMSAARYGHSATVLKDGRVLVAGGIGFDGNPLATVEIWDPLRHAWQPGPDLPLALHGHAATLLASGDVLIAGGAWVASYSRPIPWAWTWSAASDQWQVAGHAMPQSEIALSTGINLAPQPDGSAVVFTRPTIMRWMPRIKDEAPAPQWQSRPTMARLIDGRVMVVGRGIGDAGGGQPIARVWTPDTNKWADAGHLNQQTWIYEDTLELPSGRVIHVGLNLDRTLICEAWNEADNTWKDCGSLPLQYESSWRVRLGLLPSGQAFAVINTHEVAVFDELRGTWKMWRVEWSIGDMTYGAPMRGDTPLVRVYDGQNDQWIEINDAGARFWRQFGGSAMPSMLWDAKGKQWTYVLHGEKMGWNAQLLPDGCVLSTSPLAIFNPVSGEVKPLVDPGIGINESDAEMVVLDDGTVVIAGPSAAAKDTGSGFFHRKASCEGFSQAANDDLYINGDLVKDVPAAMSSVKLKAPSAGSGQSWLQNAWSTIAKLKRLILTIVGVLVSYLVLRRFGIRRIQFGSAWTLRLPVYGLFIIFVVPAIVSYVLFMRVQSRHACEDDSAQCLDSKTGILKPAEAAGSGESVIPCRYVGVWNSRHGGLVYRVELKDDGSYAMAPSESGVGSRTGYTGHWAVQGENMIWRHDQGYGDLDVNRILSKDDKGFVLVEGNGSRTKFELIRTVSSDRCQP